MKKNFSKTGKARNENVPADNIVLYDYLYIHCNISQSKSNAFELRKSMNFIAINYENV